MLVPVKNEAANLRECLASVSFAEEFVVIGSGSTDSTQAIAEAAGARVIQLFGTANCRGEEWALENVPWNTNGYWMIVSKERELEKRTAN